MEAPLSRWGAQEQTAAILGKMICAAGVLERGLDRLSVAVGMVVK